MPTKKKTRRAAAGTLPQWDLGDFYPGRRSPRIEADLGKARREARAFRKRFEGRLTDLDGAELGAAIAEFERIGEAVNRIMTDRYFNLREYDRGAIRALLDDAWHGRPPSGV